MNHKSRPWTAEEYDLLRQSSDAGKDVLSIAAMLDRTIGSVLAQMYKNGVPIPRSKLTPMSNRTE
jgi:hypothetical protein